MTELESKIYRKLVETMDLDENELEGFTEKSPIFTPRPGTSLPEVTVSMNLDSIDSLELAVMLEKEWDISEISTNDMAKFDTIKDIADYLLANGKS